MKFDDLILLILSREEKPLIAYKILNILNGYIPTYKTTLYNAIKRLEKKKLIITEGAENGQTETKDNKKLIHLTKEGRVLAEQIKESSLMKAITRSNFSRTPAAIDLLFLDLTQNKDNYNRYNFLMAQAEQQVLEQLEVQD